MFSNAGCVTESVGKLLKNPDIWALCHTPKSKFEGWGGGVGVGCRLLYIAFRAHPVILKGSQG